MREQGEKGGGDAQLQTPTFPLSTKQSLRET